MNIRNQITDLKSRENENVVFFRNVNECNESFNSAVNNNFTKLIRINLPLTFREVKVDRNVSTQVKCSLKIRM